MKCVCLVLALCLASVAAMTLEGTNYARSSRAKRSTAATSNYNMVNTVNGVAEVCVLCDQSCLANIAPTEEEVLAEIVDYIDTLSDRVKNASINIVFTLKQLDFIGTVNLADYLVGQSYSNGRERARIMNMEFWKNRYSAMRDNCDVALLFSNDAELYGLGGAANIASLCSAYSFGIIKNDGVGADVTARLIHEMGHLLGMYHDGEAVWDDFEHVNAEAGVDGIVADIYSQCNHGPPLCVAGLNKCSMKTGYYSHPYPTYLSECSKAFYDFWASHPGYTKACLTVSNSETSGSGEGSASGEVV